MTGDTHHVLRADGGQVAQDRHYPKNASLRIAADPKSHRHYVRTPDGGVLSTHATDVEQARKLAADEHPGEDLDGFELITSLCRHGMPRDGFTGCWSCTKERLKQRKEAFEWFFGEVLE